MFAFVCYRNRISLCVKCVSVLSFRLGKSRCKDLHEETMEKSGLEEMFCLVWLLLGVERLNIYVN